jgi:hypothetical protein
VPVRKFGILFLQITTIGEQYFAKITRRFGTDHVAPKSVLDQERQVARMIEVSVRQHDRLNRCRIYGQGLPIAQAKILETLKKPAIHENSGTTRVDQVFRTGDGPHAAKEGALHGVNPDDPDAWLSSHPSRDLIDPS